LPHTFGDKSSSMGGTSVVGIPKGRVPLVGRRATPYIIVGLKAKRSFAPYSPIGDNKPSGFTPTVLPRSGNPPPPLLPYGSLGEARIRIG
jgi:hypothetical protein